MLRFIDAILTFLFVYCLPVVMGLFGVICLGLIPVVISSGEKIHPIERVRIVGALGTLLACIYGFFHFLNELKSVKYSWSDDRPEVPVVVALFLFIMILGLARILNAFLIPWIVIAIIYWGIVIFGV